MLQNAWLGNQLWSEYTFYNTTKHLKKFNQKLCFHLLSATFVSQNASFSACWSSAGHNSWSQDRVRNLHNPLAFVLLRYCTFTSDLNLLSYKSEYAEARLSWISTLTRNKPSCMTWFARPINMRWGRPLHWVKFRKLFKAHVCLRPLRSAATTPKNGFQRKRLHSPWSWHP